MEMDVGHDRYMRCADDLLECRRALDIGAGDADDIDARIFAAADLVDRRLGVAGQSVGHRLHRNRRIAANGDRTDHDLSGLTARDIAPGAYGRHGGDIGLLGVRGNLCNHTTRNSLLAPCLSA